MQNFLELYIMLHVNIYGTHRFEGADIFTRRRVARKHFSSRRKSECELSVQCEVLSRVS